MDSFAQKRQEWSSQAKFIENNCFQNGILPVVLPENIVEDIIQNAEDNPGTSITVDLESQTVIGGGGLEVSFDIQPFRRTQHGVGGYRSFKHNCGIDRRRMVRCGYVDPHESRHDIAFANAQFHHN